MMISRLNIILELYLEHNTGINGMRYLTDMHALSGKAITLLHDIAAVCILLYHCGRVIFAVNACTECLVKQVNYVTSTVTE